MQVAKILYLTKEKSFTRKLQELFITLWLESKYTKAQILRLYLQSADFGNEQIGAVAAAEYYFKKPLQELTPDECLRLVLSLPSPKRYNPSLGAPPPELAERAARFVRRAQRNWPRLRSVPAVGELSGRILPINLE